MAAGAAGAFAQKGETVKIAWMDPLSGLMAAVGTNLFLGGWLSPVPFIPDSPLWFFAKFGLLLFFFIWLRGTLPRFRYDQLMHFGWKVLVPVATLSILVTAGLIVWRQ